MEISHVFKGKMSSNKSVTIPESVVREMIKVTEVAAERLRYGGDHDQSSELRVMLEMLRAGAASINPICSLDQVLELLEAKSVTQDQIDNVQAWLTLPWQDIPTRTFNHIMTLLARKVIQE